MNENRNCLVVNHDDWVKQFHYCRSRKCKGKQKEIQEAHSYKHAVDLGWTFVREFYDELPYPYCPECSKEREKENK